MLYVSTRGNADPVTAHRALTERNAVDGGLYVPMKMPSFSPEEIQQLGSKSFGQTVAGMMNLLFGCHLDGWDVDFTVGRYPFRCVSMSHRICVAELWHNLDWDFQRIVTSLTNLAAGEQIPEPGNWPKTAVRIAVLFGVFATLIKEGQVSVDEPVDLAVASGDFSAPMAAWYARSWGLPIANIIVCCNENSAPWDLIYKGELRTGGNVLATVTPDCDRLIPGDMERLIYACGGSREVENYLAAAQSGESYWPESETYTKIRRNTHASVVGNKRVISTVPNLYKTNAYLPGPYTALAYSGLLDHRSRTSESRLALVISERSPIRDGQVTADAMGIGVEELELRFL